MRPWLLLPAEFAHDIAPIGLGLMANLTRPVAADVRPFSFTRKSHTIHFRNPLGPAGGVDKDGTQIEIWKHFGAGFTEIGTVTPNPQEANAGRIISRDTEMQTLWNRMGFPSRGAHWVRGSLRDFRLAEWNAEVKHRFPVFVNIGKQRETQLTDASHDYTWLIDFFSTPLHGLSKTESPRPVDAFVINISSPNTAGLRDLFSRERFYEFLAPVAERLQHHCTPGLLKLSPDLDDATLQAVVDVSLSLDLDGFVATNTTAARTAGSHFPVEGGLSGAPLTFRSKEILKKLISTLGPRRENRLIVSAGGVLSGEEAAQRLTLGADCVQSYSGLVFEGPQFFDGALRELVRHDIVR